MCQRRGVGCRRRLSQPLSCSTGEKLGLRVGPVQLDRPLQVGVALCDLLPGRTGKRGQSARGAPLMHQ